MFVLPDGLRTVVGTTDTDWQPDPGRAVAPGDDIRARGQRRRRTCWRPPTTPSRPPRLGPDDVISTYAGLRPLLASDEASPSASSREHAIWVDDDGVLTVAGGKLTTMRSMGEETVDRLIEAAARRAASTRRCAPA